MMCANLWTKTLLVCGVNMSDSNRQRFRTLAPTKRVCGVLSFFFFFFACVFSSYPQLDLVYLEESPTMKGEMVNVHKLKSISAAIHNCVQFQVEKATYWFRELYPVQRLLSSMLVMSEDDMHKISIVLEPRDLVTNMVQPLDDPTKFKPIDRKSMLANQGNPRRFVLPRRDSKVSLGGASEASGREVPKVAVHDTSEPKSKSRPSSLCGDLSRSPSRSGTDSGLLEKLVDRTSRRKSVSEVEGKDFAMGKE